ncbi:T9SS type A sorting domain-containing protein [candidate division KSB1 bacterium]|nr:T9SS type A sorting domain-containing protein [candidate division KSB1 bacterium]
MITLILSLLLFLFFNGFSTTSNSNAPVKSVFDLNNDLTNVLNNGDFEQPALPPNSMRLYKAIEFPGWLTTAEDQLLEVWSSAFMSVSAANGNQFLEINATQAASVYQDIQTIPGDLISWRFSHRGRLGSDTLDFYLGEPGSETKIGRFATSADAWQEYSGSWEVPEGQAITRVRFASVASAGGDPAKGNFIDKVVIDIQRETDADSDADGIADDVDQCPDTPFGTPVDENGCPMAWEDAEVCQILPGPFGLWFSDFGPATGERESWAIDSRAQNSFVKFSDGTGWIRYTVVNGDKRIFLNLVLKNKMDWAAWSGLDRTYNLAPGDHTDWNYYEIDSEKSYRVQLWDNDTTRIQQSPVDLQIGVQEGLGATKTGAYGIRSWLLMPNIGSFVFEYDNCGLVSDTDADGVIDLFDTDDDNDGISDLVEGNGAVDYDRDNYPDSRDLDSDNDGIPDNIEAQSTSGWIAASQQDDDSNGMDDAYGVTGLTPVDTDNDGLADYRDPDSDNDGVFDLYESGLPKAAGTDTDADGLDISIDADDNTFGPADAGLNPPVASLQDSDGDAQTYGNLDFRDTDDDGDDVLSRDENNDPNRDGNPSDARDANGDLLPDYLDANSNVPDRDGDGIADDADADDDGDGILDNTEGNDDFDGDGLANSMDLDSDDDGIPDNIEAQSTAGYVAPSGTDADNNGIDDVYGVSGLSPVNKDGDGDPDYLDFDCDNDGLYDTFETGLPAQSGIDKDDDGLDDAVDADDLHFGPVNAGMSNPAATLQDWDQDVSANGDCDWRDYDDDGDGLGTFHEIADPDTDGDPVDAQDIDQDGTPDYLDVDDDDDGILTRYENPDANHNSRPDDAQDSDGDNVPDYLDSDDDGDGIASAIEGNDPDGDGRPTDARDSDKDGIPDYLDATSSGDLDGDGIADLQDKDDDGDGIPDTIEGDADFDGDRIPNYYDLDSDNDGIPDNIEAQTTLGYVAPLGTDSNGDGIDDAYGDGIQPVNSDARGNYDFLDIDADDDGPEDNFESGLPALSGLDDDRDGLDNAIDADDTAFGPVNGNLNDPVSALLDTDDDAGSSGGDLNYRDWDDDGDHVRTDMEDVDPDFNGIPDDAVDRDGDGVPDYLDADDDNDGVLTIHEAPNPDGDPDFDPEDARDFDGDGLPDYLDADDDGDGISSAREGNDPNKNGQPDDAVDLNQNGLVDYLDPDLSHDTDGDGVPDITDIDDDNDGIPDAIELDVDADGDALGNAHDLDSDDDGIPDNIEAQTTTGYRLPSGQDSDGDGLDDSYEPDGLVSLPDKDNDERADFVDSDADQDGINDSAESGLVALQLQDKDFDGLDDAIDSDDTRFGPVNADIIDPASELQDADFDVSLAGDVDYRDNDRYAPGGVSGGLVLWLRSDTATSTISNNGLISSWLDQSPIHHIAIASGGQQPFYSLNPGDMINGYPTVCFMGDDDYMQIPNGVFTAGETVSELTVFVVNKTSLLGNALQLAQYGLNDTRTEVATPDLTAGHHADFIVGTGERTPGNLDMAARQSIENHSFIWSMRSSANLGERSIFQNGALTFHDTEAGAFYPGSSAAYIGGNSQNGFFNGCLAEIIVYQRDLTGFERINVENYLSVKYGISIPSTSNNYFNISGFENMVAGIARDDISGLRQFHGRHQDDIVQLQRNEIPDNCFLFWGNNGGNLATNATAPQTIEQRLNRIWRVNGKGSPGSVELAFDLENVPVFQNREAAQYALLVCADGDFSRAKVFTSGRKFTESVLSFSDVELVSGDYFSLGYGIAATGVVRDSEMPTTFRLEQNFPNPFNPETEIRYVLPEAALVKITVYDILGRKVAELVNERKVAGKHSVKFNASHFSSGLYFYRISAGRNTAVRKMLFLK